MQIDECLQPLKLPDAIVGEIDDSKLCQAFQVLNDLNSVVVEEERVKRFVRMEIVNNTEPIVLQMKRIIQLLVFVSLLISKADKEVFLGH